jgi:hypothetical protein
MTVPVASTATVLAIATASSAMLLLGGCWIGFAASSLRRFSRRYSLVARQTARTRKAASPGDVGPQMRYAGPVRSGQFGVVEASHEAHTGPAQSSSAGDSEHQWLECERRAGRPHLRTTCRSLHRLLSKHELVRLRGAGFPGASSRPVAFKFLEVGRSDGSTRLLSRRLPRCQRHAISSGSPVTVWFRAASI